MNLFIDGGRPLSGEIEILGAKNAFLPLIAASCLTEKTVVFDNIPLVDDTLEKIDLLEKAGAKIIYESGRKIHLNTKELNPVMNFHSRIRTSILFTGVLLGRFGFCSVPYPKGDSIGDRNTNFHIDALSKMGAEFIFHEDFFEAKTNRLIGIEYTMPFPSNGATHNLILAASMAHGTTIINNASIEPETICLCNFLRELGVSIPDVGRSRIIIEGSGGVVYNSHNVQTFSIISDRVQAGTYLVAGAITGGDITIKGDNFLLSLGIFLDYLTKLGSELIINNRSVRCISKANANYEALEILTDIFPSLATDLQPILVPLLCCKSEKAVLQDLIFNGRFRYVSELQKMGGLITQKNKNTIEISRIEQFSANQTLVAYDIRGGASVLLAALNANGISKIFNSYQLCRGYDNLIHNLCFLGANIDIEHEECYEKTSYNLY